MPPTGTAWCFPRLFAALTGRSGRRQRNRIPAHGCPRMAPDQTADRQPCPAHRAVTLNSLQRVGGAGRDVPALRRAPDTSQLVLPDRTAAKPCCQPPHRRTSLNNPPTVARSSAADRVSSGAKIPSRYSPPASTTARSRTSSCSAPRTRRRALLRTTAVPTDFGTTNRTRDAPGAARWDTLRGPRRAVVVRNPSLTLRLIAEPLTRPVDFAPCGGVCATRHARRESSSWLEIRVSYAFFLYSAERGASLDPPRPAPARARHKSRYPGRCCG